MFVGVGTNETPGSELGIELRQIRGSFRKTVNARRDGLEDVESFVTTENLGDLVHVCLASLKNILARTDDGVKYQSVLIS